MLLLASLRLGEIIKVLYYLRLSGIQSYSAFLLSYSSTPFLKILWSGAILMPAAYIYGSAQLLQKKVSGLTFLIIGLFLELFMIMVILGNHKFVAHDRALFFAVNLATAYVLLNKKDVLVK